MPFGITPAYLGAFHSTQNLKKIPRISFGTSNGTDYFGLVRQEYSGPALKAVAPFHLTKSPLFWILLYVQRAVAWVGYYRSIGHVESENISAWQAKKLVGMGKEERWKRKVRARGKGKGAPSLPLSRQSPHFYPSFHSLPFYAGYERFFVACDGEVRFTSGEAARINLWRRAPWFTVLDGPWPCL